MSIVKLDEVSYASKLQEIENWLANAESEPTAKEDQQLANLINLRLQQALMGLNTNNSISSPPALPRPIIRPTNDYDRTMTQFNGLLKTDSIAVPPPPISPILPNGEFNHMYDHFAFGDSATRNQPLYGRKVFLGGLPIGITADEVLANFDRFGVAHIDWPHKDFHEKVPPAGYAFVIYEDPRSVNALVEACVYIDCKYVFGIRRADGSKRTIEVKPWEMKNNEMIACSEWHQFERLAVFIGGLPRTITAGKLAAILQEDVGGVAYVSIEVDEKTDYPKGAAKVIFNNWGSYYRAIGVHDLTVVAGGQQRLAEIKPFLHPKMKCEHCRSAMSTSFCPKIRCLKYYCDNCWVMKHSAPGMIDHKPMQKGRPNYHGNKKGVRTEASLSHPLWYQSRSSNSSSLESLLLASTSFFNNYGADPRLHYRNSFDPTVGGTSPGISPYTCFSNDSMFDFPKL